MKRRDKYVIRFVNWVLRTFASDEYVKELRAVIWLGMTFIDKTAERQEWED